MSNQPKTYTTPTHPLPETGDGRAQPGDVLGIERDGEQTHIGETREDEDKRRIDAEKAAREQRKS